MALENLVGQKYGKLTVLKQMESGRGGRQWSCQCECGNIVKVYTKALKRGETKSCGCLQFKRVGNRTNHTTNRNGGRKPEDLTNHRFYKLLVLEITPERKNGSAVWKCQCDCGNIVYVPASSLKNNGTKSCGCIHSFGEQRITNILQENNYNFVREYNIKINDSNRRYDFAIIEDNKITRLIEFDGMQHYTKGTGYLKNAYDDIHTRDIEKNIWAKENNIPLVRIPYTLRDTVCLEDIIGESYLV